jgi:hypothetical protein
MRVKVKQNFKKPSKILLKFVFNIARITCIKDFDISVEKSFLDCGLNKISFEGLLC